jgi:hypothetical protein
MAYPAKPEDWGNPEFRSYNYIKWQDAVYESGTLRITARCGNRDPEKSHAENHKQLMESDVLNIRLRQGMCVIKVHSVYAIDQQNLEDICKRMNGSWPNRVDITNIKLAYGGVDYANAVTVSLSNLDG